MKKKIELIIKNFNTPVWYILIVVAVSIAVILYGIIYPGIQFTKGIFVDPALYNSPYVLEKVQPFRLYAVSWNELDIISAFFCLFMGFVCFVLGIARSINRLGGRQIYMLALFLGLFSVNTLSLIEISASYFDQTILFYTYWFTYFTYPIAFIIHLYSYFNSEVKKWIWSLLGIPIAYSAASLMAHLIFGLPYELFGKTYNPTTAVCLIMILITGFFKIKQKPTSLFIRILSGYWIIWTCYMIFKILIKSESYLHNEYKNGITATAIFIVCFIIFTNSRELFLYKYDLQILSMQNRLVRESYEKTKNHIHEIGSIKHEVKNHLNAMQILLKNKRYEEAANYLNRYTEEVNTINEIVYHENILINSIVDALIYKAKELGIQIELDLKASPSNIDDFGLYSLFSNIINNALESCKLTPEGTNRFIKLAISKKEPYFNIICINSMYGERILVDGQFQTTKHDGGHGYGLKVIERIVNNYDGILDVDYNKNIFKVMVSLKDK